MTFNVSAETTIVCIKMYLAETINVRLTNNWKRKFDSQSQ